ncbi:MAG: T9SS type A sorting domain-containing protein [Duncaniella sp.]|nr:T9SS type A sorting domain-containing protein [Duncaniella sp.]
MKTIRALCLALTLITSGTMLADLITKSLRITLRDGRTLVLDLSAGQKEGEAEAVLPMMTFTPTAMKIELPARTDPENPTVTVEPVSYTFEVEDLKGMAPIGTEQVEDMSGIAATLAPQDDIVISLAGRDEVVISGREGIEPTDVRLYDMGGTSLAADVTAAGEGRLTLSLASLPAGVYIVKIQSATLKVTKR